MFTIDTLVSTVQSYAKTPLAFVTNKSVRQNLEQIIDAQADYTKATAKAVTEIFTTVGQEVQSFDYSKFYAVPAAK